MRGGCELLLWLRERWWWLITIIHKNTRIQHRFDIQGNNIVRETFNARRWTTVIVVGTIRMGDRLWMRRVLLLTLQVLNLLYCQRLVLVPDRRRNIGSRGMRRRLVMRMRMIMTGVVTNAMVTVMEFLWCQSLIFVVNVRRNVLFFLSRMRSSTTAVT